VNRIRYGEKWAGLSALALLGFLFMDWFEISAVVQGSSSSSDGNTLGFVNVISGGGVSGWDSLGWLALALVVLALLAGLALPLVFATHESPVLPQFTAVCALLIGSVAAIALVVQVIFQPGPDEIVSVQSGWWLGFLATLGIARGGYLSMHDEYLQDVPLPDVEVRPAPVA
jgi:hypothetical protein